MSVPDEIGRDSTACRVEFDPGPVRRTELAADRFRSDLLQTIRLAQGLGVGLRLTWRSGPRATIGLAAAGSFGRGWLEGSLARAYGPGRWNERPPPCPPDRWPTRAFGRLPVGGTVPPLPSDSAEPWSDGVTRALLRVLPGIGIRWSLRPIPPRPQRAPLAPPLEAAPSPLGWRLAPLTAPERELRDRLERSHRSIAWSALVEIVASTTVPDLAVWQVARLVQVASGTQGGSALGWRRASRWTRISSQWCALSEEEAAGLFPEPWSGVGAAAPGDTASLGLPIGTGADGRRLRLGLPAEEGRHLVVLGETGMGKSSAIVALGLAAVRNCGLMLFDPIGDTAREFLRRLAPGAIGRTVWVSPKDSPVAINALAGLCGGEPGRPGRDKPLNDLVAAFRRVRAFRYLESPFWGPRIEETLTRVLRVAAALSNGTLADAENLLHRGPRLPTGIPAGGESDAAELHALATERPDEVEGTRRLLAEVTRNETLRSLLCARNPRLQSAELVAPGRIVVISGDAPVIGENAARYLLAIHLALAWPNLLARSASAKTVVILDEAQWYAHEAVAEILRLGRRANVHLWMATQGLASLPEGVREAALTNAADFLLFRGSPVDAREFVRWHPSLDEPTLLGLERGTAILLQAKGRSATWLRTSRLAPARHPVESEAEIAGGCARFRAPPELNPVGEAPEATPPRANPDPTILLHVIWAAFDSSAGSAELGITLDQLRRAVGPSDASLREVGRALQGGGALGRDRRVRGEPGWWIQREAFDRILGAPPAGESAERARDRWASVHGGGSAD